MNKNLLLLFASSFLISCTQNGVKPSTVQEDKTIAVTSDSLVTKDNFEDAVDNVLKAFQNKDEILVNNLVSEEHGVVIIYRTGVFNEYKTIYKIDFNSPVPQNFPYPSLTTDFGLTYEALPKFNCGTMEWNKHGLYCDTIRKDTLLSGTPQNLIKYRGDKIADTEVQKLKRLEEKSRRVVLAHPGKDFIFYLTLIDNKWYLTAIDRITTDCSA